MASRMSSAVELYIQDYTIIESGGLLTETSNLASVPIADRERETGCCAGRWDKGGTAA